MKIADGKAVIQMESSSECQSCAAKNACATLSDDSARQIELPLTSELAYLREGDDVELSFEPGSRILSAFLVFLSPIIFMIAGYFIGFTLTGKEGLSILSAFAGLAIAFILIKFLNKYIIKDTSFMPTVVKAV